MKLKTVVEAILPTNCFYNFKEEGDGLCRSTTCMMNAHKEMAKIIKEEGCGVFKNHPDVVRMRFEKDAAQRILQEREGE